MRSLVFTTAACAAFAGAAACGGGSGSPTTPGTNPVTISIVGERGAQSFSPNPATAAGRTVVFKNNDSVVHRVRLNDGSIDTGDIAPGATSSAVTMPGAGTNYHCSLHPTMVGSVGGSNSAPPPCSGIYC